jgi:hypothetical protein
MLTDGSWILFFQVRWPILAEKEGECASESRGASYSLVEHPRALVGRLLPERPTHRSDEACLVVEHGQAKLVATLRNFHLDRHHHAFIQNLLISSSIKRPINLGAATREVLAT